MTLIQTNIKKMDDAGRQMLSLANRYIENINEFKKIASDEKSWNGVDADAFRRDIKSNCLIYDEVGKILKEYANFLIKESQNIDKISRSDTIE